ncbi:hypothetical protein DPMN_119964 [Dreissena polymorpha]|uniref:Uncharacterized protein n=1 Tax=Dreissena polymorpha TaxID=45954 RepID=A0A9D4GQW1_DREPO|nr:hypothetical protein DPMN_119964 [Dreissena polymorpha]
MLDTLVRLRPHGHILSVIYFFQIEVPNATPATGSSDHVSDRDLLYRRPEVEPVCARHG